MRVKIDVITLKNYLAMFTEHMHALLSNNSSPWHKPCKSDCMQHLDMYKNVPSTITCDSPKVETIQYFINMDKHIVVYQFYRTKIKKEPQL